MKRLGAALQGFPNLSTVEIWFNGDCCDADRVKMTIKGPGNIVQAAWRNLGALPKLQKIAVVHRCYASYDEKNLFAHLRDEFARIERMDDEPCRWASCDHEKQDSERWMVEKSSEKGFEASIGSAGSATHG